MTKIAGDIITLPIEINAKMADSKFRLVHIASQRVRELSGGAAPLVASKSIKDTTIALEESILGAYRIITGDDAQTAKEEMRKRKEQELLQEQLSAKEEEIRKELTAYLTETQEESELTELGEETGAEESEEPSDEEVGEETAEE
jgi:DNA-directed RNA polymerase omega subunit